MFPICLENIKKEFKDFNEFNEFFYETCKSHLAENKALAFCFLLYDCQNPSIRKILKDEEYWEALNNLSGKYLTIFSFDTRKSKVNIDLENNPTGPNLSFMTSFSGNFNIDRMNKNILENYFEKSDTINYPLLLFFQFDKNTFTDAFIVFLKHERIEDSFFEIRDYIKKASETLRLIKPENKNNYTEIFSQLKLRISDTRNLKYLQLKAKNIRDIISFVKLAV